MVYFKDISSLPGMQHLIILDDESHDIGQGTILAVYDPLIGRYAKQWPKLTNRLHLREWSREIPPVKDSKSKMWALEATHHQQSDEPILLPTLGHGIIEGEAKWGDLIRFLPRSCNRLLHAYHLLQGSAHGDHYLLVSIDDWINFWFKKATKYSSPPVRIEKKALRKDKQTEHPESTHNPLGDIGAHGEWSPAEKALFSKLETIESLINSKPKKALPKGKSHRHGPLGENIRCSPLVHVVSSPKRCDALDVEACESNKRKVVISSFEESSSSDADRHWKILKKTPKQQEADGVATRIPSKAMERSREKISNIPIDSLSSIQDEVMVVLESMNSFNIIDVCFVEGSLKDLFAKAIAYNEGRSSSSEIVSKELLARQLSEVEDRLHDAKTKEAKESAQISSNKEELESINRELDNLRKRKKNLTASLKRQEELFHIAHTEVQQIEEEITTI
ncbi:hypothetical protein DH2020_022127 [Rehmannia glutinosa]|uniref:Aminotransferase-like plant mobile domain-containing protein n=1 Tax=Rehmannia glutinosa TaxID=99300 RepID=A0ABR0WCG1_REHGL